MDLFQNKGHWWIFIVQTGGIPQTKLEPKINSCEPNRKFWKGTRKEMRWRRIRLLWQSARDTQSLLRNHLDMFLVISDLGGSLEGQVANWTINSWQKTGNRFNIYRKPEPTKLRDFRQSLPQTIIYRMKANKKNRFNATKSSMQQAERSPNQSLAGIHALLQWKKHNSRIYLRLQ